VQADGNLAITDFAECARILPLHANGLVPLLREPRVIHAVRLNLITLQSKYRRLQTLEDVIMTKASSLKGPLHALSIRLHFLWGQTARNSEGRLVWDFEAETLAVPGQSLDSLLILEPMQMVLQE